MDSTVAVRVARGHGGRRIEPPRPEAAGSQMLRYRQLSRRQRQLLEQDFRSQILPALTPMALDAGHPFPRLGHRSIHLAVMLKEPGYGERFGSLTVPSMFPRRWRIPGQPESGKFVWLEEMVAANVDSLFPGLEVLSTSPFRVRRAASADAGSGAEPLPWRRRNGNPVDTVLRLEVERGMPRRTRDLLIRSLGIQPEQAVTVDGPLQPA